MNLFPSGFLSFPLWGKAGMGAGHDLKHGRVVWATPGWLAPTLALPQRGRERITLTPALSHKWEREYTQAMVRQVVGMHWVAPHPPPVGEGIEAGEVNPSPSGFLSFPLWGKAGMGACQP